MRSSATSCQVLGELDVLHLFRGGILQIGEIRFSLPKLGYPTLQMIMAGAENWHRTRPSLDDSVPNVREVTGL
ncbi:MAG: hypothetical protein ACYTGL_29975 [Planctomycetota bacterium]